MNENKNNILKLTSYESKPLTNEKTATSNERKYSQMIWSIKGLTYKYINNSYSSTTEQQPD